MKQMLPFEPFKMKTVESIRVTSKPEREEYLKRAHFNPFLLRSQDVMIDLLTDSGTSAMSDRQWAGMMAGDEAYAGSKSWERMREVIASLTEMEYIFPVHQGRAGERILYGTLGGPGKIFISNTHFDTTRANIEFSGATAMDIPVKQSLTPHKPHPFKGNLDTSRLRELIHTHGARKIAAVILTVTNNSGGGQPVSMQNAREVSRICRDSGIPFFLDCCRIAENSWFIQNREAGFEQKSCKDIAREMFSLADGAVMSLKKDGLANIGGFLTLRNPELADTCRTNLIITEGYETYGGLTGRDMEAIAQGLTEVFEQDYLDYRVGSIRDMGQQLADAGIPIVKPTGGHAVYIDAKAFYPQIPVEQYPGQTLVCNLYTEGGIRAVETGSVMFGKYDENGTLIPAAMELVRLAIPRRVYSRQHLDYVVQILIRLFENQTEAKGLEITYEPSFLRHFTAKFKLASRVECKI